MILCVLLVIKTFKNNIAHSSVVVVRLSVHVHFNLGLSPRDS